MKVIDKLFLPIIVAIAAGFVLYIIGPIVFAAITNPIVLIDPVEQPIDNDFISAKQIEVLLNDEIQKIEKLNEYDLEIGSIEMELNADQRGGISVKYVENGKDGGESKVILAQLSTRTKILHSIQDLGRDGKNYPGGTIGLCDWIIDSTDALGISEEFFSDSQDFRYDEIRIKSCSYYHGNEKTWDVFLTDKRNNIRYETRINPYTGEVVSHNVR